VRCKAVAVAVLVLPAIQQLDQPTKVWVVQEWPSQFRDRQRRMLPAEMDLEHRIPPSNLQVLQIPETVAVPVHLVDLVSLFFRTTHLPVLQHRQLSLHTTQPIQLLERAKLFLQQRHARLRV
jgi:hypothetical protein